MSPVVRRTAVAVGLGAVGIALVLGAWRGRSTPALVVGAILGSSPREQAVRQGLELARAALDPEVPIELRILDPQNNAQQAEQHLKALEAAGVTFVADLRGGRSLLHGVATHLRSSKLVVLSTDPDPDAGGVGERFFRVAPWDGAAACELAEWTRDVRVTKPLVVVPADEQGRGLRASFVRAFHGIPESFVLEMDDPAAQASWAARRAKELEVDCVALLLPSQGGLKIAEALHATGMSPLLFTLDPALGPALKGSPASALLPRVRLATPEEQTLPARALVDAAYKEAHGGQPSSDVYAGWDALHLAANVWRASGGDVERALTLLRETETLGASGPLAFRGDGERRPSPYRRRTFTPEGVGVPWSMDAEGAP